jgi:hypothetical protein
VLSHIRSVAQQEGRRHRTNVVSDAIGHQREKGISAFITEDTERLEGANVAPCVLVASFRIAASHRVSLRSYTVPKLTNQLLQAGHGQTPLITFWIARFPNSA